MTINKTNNFATIEFEAENGPTTANLFLQFDSIDIQILEGGPVARTDIYSVDLCVEFPTEALEDLPFDLASINPSARSGYSIGIIYSKEVPMTSIKETRTEAYLWATRYVERFFARLALLGSYYYPKFLPLEQYQKAA